MQPSHTTIYLNERASSLHVRLLVPLKRIRSILPGFNSFPFTDTLCQPCYEQMIWNLSYSAPNMSTLLRPIIAFSARYTLLQMSCCLWMGWALNSRIGAPFPILSTLIWPQIQNPKNNAYPLPDIVSQTMWKHSLLLVVCKTTVFYLIK